MHDLPLLLIRIAAVIFVLIFILCLAWLVSRLSGWAQLAEAYPCKDPFPYKIYRGFFIRMRYQLAYNAVDFSLDEKGIYLRNYFNLIKFIYAPVFIPWVDIKFYMPRNQASTFSRVKLTFKKVSEVSIFFRHGAIADKFINDICMASPQSVAIAD